MGNLVSPEQMQEFLKEAREHDPNRTQKSVDKYETYMHHARRARAVGRLDHALSCLNTILIELPRSAQEQLSTVYALRAEILLSGRYFEPAAKDAARVLRLTKNDALLAPMRTTLNLCKNHMAESVPQKTDGKEEAKSKKWPTEAIANKNPMVPCASEAIALVGKRFVATRDIRPGEVLMVEEPLASFIDLAKFGFPYCGHCFKNTLAPIPCDFCNFYVFCDEKCKDAALSHPGLHQRMCPVVADMKTDNEEPRVVLLWFSMIANFKKLSVVKPDVQLGVTKPLECGDLSSMLHLIDLSAAGIPHMIRANVEMLVECMQLRVEPTPEEEMHRLVPALLWSLGSMPEAMASIEHLIVSNKNGREDIFKQIGLGLYPILALVAPACSPNAIAFNVGDKSVLQATRIIPKGALVTRKLHQELDFLHVGRPLRWLILRALSVLGPEEECQCEACLLDWPTQDEMESRTDDQATQTLIAKKLDPQLLPFALAKAEEMELKALKHTKEFHLLQRRICMCLAARGNVAPSSYFQI